MAQNEITRDELRSAHEQGMMTFMEYLDMLKVHKQGNNPRTVDWFAEEGQR